MRYDFENVLALSDVLDEIHRKTIVETLSRVGVSLATNSWSEIETTIAIPELPVDPDDVFCRVEYIGAGEEPVSEDIAKQLIYALQNESTRPYNMGKDR